MENKSQRKLFLGQTSLQAVRKTPNAYEFKAFISPQSKNTSIIDSWVQVLALKGYCELEKNYHSAVFFKKPSYWNAFSFNRRIPWMFVSLRLRVNPEKGNKIICLNTLNESADAVRALIEDVHGVLMRVSAPRLGFGSKLNRADDSYNEEGFQIYLAFTHFSHILFSTKYSLGHSISLFVSTFNRREKVVFVDLYQVITDTLTVVCKDYNVNNMDAKWIFTYGFEVIETIFNQFVYESLVKVYLRELPRRVGSSGKKFQSEQKTVCDALADIWRLFAASVSMLEKLLLLDELFFTARMMSDAEEFGSVDFCLTAGLQALEEPRLVEASYRMLQDFLAQTRISHPAAVHLESLRPLFNS